MIDLRFNYSNSVTDSDCWLLPNKGESERKEAILSIEREKEKEKGKGKEKEKRRVDRIEKGMMANNWQSERGKRRKS